MCSFIQYRERCSDSRPLLVGERNGSVVINKIKYDEEDDIKILLYFNCWFE